MSEKDPLTAPRLLKVPATRAREHRTNASRQEEDLRARPSHGRTGNGNPASPVPHGDIHFHIYIYMLCICRRRLQRSARGAAQRARTRASHGKRTRGGREQDRAPPSRAGEADSEDRSSSVTVAQARKRERPARLRLDAPSAASGDVSRPLSVPPAASDLGRASAVLVLVRLGWVGFSLFLLRFVLFSAPARQLMAEIRSARQAKKSRNRNINRN